MWMTVGEERFAIRLADSETARSFAAQLPLDLEMTDLHNNEKYADLPKALPGQPTMPGTIEAGDLMLWDSKTVVVFYKSFRSSYSYVRLGRIENPEALAKALGRGDVRVQFSKE